MSTRGTAVDLHVYCTVQKLYFCTVVYRPYCTVYTPVFCCIILLFFFFLPVFFDLTRARAGISRRLGATTAVRHALGARVRGGSATRRRPGPHRAAGREESRYALAPTAVELLRRRPPINGACLAAGSCADISIDDR
eukprot:COSAG05_NODE_1206_length_5525_cov_6.815149_7_plen_137_part_00